MRWTSHVPCVMAFTKRDIFLLIRFVQCLSSDGSYRTTSLLAYPSAASTYTVCSERRWLRLQRRPHSQMISRHVPLPVPHGHRRNLRFTHCVNRMSGGFFRIKCLCLHFLCLVWFGIIFDEKTGKGFWNRRVMHCVTEHPHYPYTALTLSTHPELAG